MRLYHAICQLIEAKAHQLAPGDQGDECLCVGNIRGTLNTALECPHHAPSSNQEDQ